MSKPTKKYDGIEPKPEPTIDCTNGSDSNIRRSAKLKETMKVYSSNRSRQQQDRPHINIRAAKIASCGKNTTPGPSGRISNESDLNNDASNVPPIVPLRPPGEDDAIPTETSHIICSAATAGTCNDDIVAGVPVATAVQDDVESPAQSNNNNVLIVHARIIPDGQPLRRKVLCALGIVIAAIVLICTTVLIVIFYALDDSTPGTTLPVSPTLPPIGLHSTSPSSPPSLDTSSAPSYPLTNILLESSKWKLTVDGSEAERMFLWDVVELEFYSDYDCAPTFKIDLSSGEPIDSMHYTGNAGWGPENAFDGNPNSRWGGRQDSEGKLWIGMDFATNAVRVRCFKLTQFGGNHANGLSVQNYRDETDQWETVFKADDLYSSGWNETDQFGDILNINAISLPAPALSLAPSLSPTQTPSATPSTLPTASPTWSYRKELETTFEHNNGGSGNMFDVFALRTISIREFDIHTPFGEFEVQVYTKSGSLNGFEVDASAWSLISTATVEGEGEYFRTPLPPNAFVPVNLMAGATQAFGIITTVILYTNGVSQGSLYVSDSNLQLFEGVGLGSTTIGSSTVYSPRVWNGAIRYNVGSYTAFRLLSSVSQTERGIWDVNEITFYSDFDCAPGSEIELDPSGAIDSAHYSGGGDWGPENAFDNNLNSRWGGRADYQGNLWIGMIMDSTAGVDVDVRVRCVKLGQYGGNHANEVTVQGFRDDTEDWDNIVKSHTIGWNETDVHGDIIKFNLFSLPSSW